MNAYKNNLLRYARLYFLPSIVIPYNSCGYIFLWTKIIFVRVKPEKLKKKIQCDEDRADISVSVISVTYHRFNSGNCPTLSSCNLYNILYLCEQGFLSLFTKTSIKNGHEGENVQKCQASNGHYKDLYWCRIVTRFLFFPKNIPSSI